MNQKKAIGVLLLLLLILMILCNWCHLNELAKKQILQQNNNTPNQKNKHLEVQVKNKNFTKITLKKDTKVQNEARVIEEKVQTLLAVEHIHFKSNRFSISNLGINPQRLKAIG